MVKRTVFNLILAFIIYFSLSQIFDSTTVAGGLGLAGFVLANTALDEVDVLKKKVEKRIL
jgi:hypothetical protein